MNKTLARVLAKSRAWAGKLAYTAPVRSVARRVIGAPETSTLKRMAEERGLDGALRRIASEGLPPGMFFAKLTIHSWEQGRNKPFRLSCRGEVVYGNTIEPPPLRHPLEYRNIVVRSDDLADFALDISLPYTLQIGRGTFSTPQQVKYDKQYGVEQHGHVFYSLRGNTTNPSKILVTFPGFGPSTTRISYAVSYLKQLTDADLGDTLLIAFQDRYLVSGTYMLLDNAGRPLYDRVHAVIDGFRRRHRISDADMLFFGASKGGSIALTYARDFPQSTLVVVVPQMNLPYYFNKPFFRDNLFRVAGLHEIVQPETLLRQYFDEGRSIHYFYTNNDELSNHSLIEFVRDVPGLTKYRIDGTHSQVARAALPATMGLLRRFLKGNDRILPVTVEDLHFFPAASRVALQMRVDSSTKLPSATNWFLEGSLGRSRFNQIVSSHTYPFVKFTGPDQTLSPIYDEVSSLTNLVAVHESGRVWRGALPGPVPAPGKAKHVHLGWEPLTLDTTGVVPSGVARHVIMDAKRVGRFDYHCRSAREDGDTLLVHLTNVPERDHQVTNLPTAADSPRYVANVAALDGSQFIPLMIVRLATKAKVERIHVVVHHPTISWPDLSALIRCGWPQVSVQARAVETHAGAERTRLARLVASGQVSTGVQRVGADT